MHRGAILAYLQSSLGQGAIWSGQYRLVRRYLFKPVSFKVKKDKEKLSHLGNKPRENQHVEKWVISLRKKSTATTT